MPTLNQYAAEATRNLEGQQQLSKAMHIGVLTVIQWGIRRKRSKAQVISRLNHIAGRKLPGEHGAIDILRDAAKRIEQDKSLELS